MLDGLRTGTDKLGKVVRVDGQYQLQHGNKIVASYTTRILHPSSAPSQSLHLWHKTCSRFEKHSPKQVTCVRSAWDPRGLESFWLEN